MNVICNITNRRTGKRCTVHADGSFVLTGPALGDGTHIAVASGPRGPAMAFEAATAEAARALAEAQRQEMSDRALRDATPISGIGPLMSRDTAEHSVPALTSNR